mmetsp:Transcript_31366/g.106320  ORF Transcript_31366/g.106320 Transcript_31366/m.106320 type:complete len:95 (+) Transcript_31366:277-561(+)
MAERGCFKHRFVCFGPNFESLSATGGDLIVLQVHIGQNRRNGNYVDSKRCRSNIAKCIVTKDEVRQPIMWSKVMGSMQTWLLTLHDMIRHRISR